MFEATFTYIFRANWYCKKPFHLLFGSSVTRLGDLVHFGQLFNARGNNYFAQIANTFYAIFVNLSNSFILLAKSFLGNFWRLFTGHTVWLQDSNLHSLDEESPVKSYLHQGYCYFFKYHVRVTGFGKKNSTLATILKISGRYWKLILYFAKFDHFICYWSYFHCYEWLNIEK